jgi:prepilin-type N-terminal cleavage/methylation domain-containing protein
MKPDPQMPARRGRVSLDATRWRRAPGFTLIELILVMGVLATLAAVIVPSLSSFVKGRDISQEGLRFVALTHFARNEAISTGIAQTLWVDPRGNAYGLREAPGFRQNTNAARSYPLNAKLEFQLDPNAGQAFGEFAIRFLPDGEIEEGSLTNLAIERPNDERLWIALSTNGFNYEIAGNERL